MSRQPAPVAPNCRLMNTELQIKGSLAEAKEELVIKLGLDVHAGQITVCRQIGGLVPQPAQKWSWEATLGWIGAQKQRGAQIFSCYEAGPCGYGLHRTLEAMGVKNLVVVPKRWERGGKRVKTDKRDARELVDRLDGHLRGNTEAFSLVWVPTPEQEQRRSWVRQRETLLKERNRCVLRGHGMMLSAGLRAKAGWWHPKKWGRLQVSLPDWLREQLALWQAQALNFEGEAKKLEQKIRQFSAGKALPKGLGTLTDASIESEILDWRRFKNRRQISSYTGLCPSESTSDERRIQGAVNKHGNPRIRHHLVEAIWRLEKYQPHYPGLKLLREARASKRARKQAAVAAARRLAVDLWRIATGQCSAQQLGLHTVVPAKV